MKTILQILIILQILAQTTAFAQAIWNGKADTKWYRESQNEFTITKPEQLAGLAKLVNEGKDFKDKTVKLRANIMLNDTANWQNSWIPIGLHDKPFSGTFDGNRFVVKGVYINNPNKKLQGLFGHVDSNGTIKNLGVAAHYIAGLDGVGGLAGWNQGTIINCYSDGTVVGDERVGGLVGDNYAGKIINSYSAGAVRGYLDVGGLLGINEDDIGNSHKYMPGGYGGYGIEEVEEIREIRESKRKKIVAVEIVSVLYSYTIRKYSVISNNYSTARVAGKINEGGLVGYSFFDNRISHNYYDKETSGQKRGIGKQGEMDEGSDFGKVESKTTAQMQSKEFAESLNLLAGFFSANVWVSSAGGYPVLSGKVANLDSYFASGNGTKKKPYAISTKKHLENFSFLVNSGAHFADKHIKLENHIALNDTANWRNWENNPPASKWIPIGSFAEPFSGTFDGGGYTIRGMYINNAGECQGLFGFLDSKGTIKNLGVIAHYIAGLDGVGGLAGWNLGTITNSYSNGTVRGNENVGGLAGENYEGKIINSYSAGRVVGNEEVGGLVGRGYGEIISSYSTAWVIGKKDAYGFSGYYSGEDTIIIKNYYDKETSGGNSKGGKAEGKTTMQMKQKATFANWDFKETWGIKNTINCGYPHLLGFKYNEGPENCDNEFAKLTSEIDWYSKSATEFTITTPKQLTELAKLLNSGNNFAGKTFKLGGNIMLNDTANWQNWASKPPANKWIPIGNRANPFNGIFDGMGYAISGIYINNTGEYQGLFGFIDSIGAVKNFGISASYIINSKIENDIKIVGPYFMPVGNYNAGGFAGFNEGTISNCYFSGKVKGQENAGGIAGKNDGTISNCYSTGMVEGQRDVGGLVGKNYSVSGKIRGSYYDKEKSGKSEFMDGGKTSAEMKQKSTYKGWDFDKVWGISGEVNGGYPYFLSK